MPSQALALHVHQSAMCLDLSAVRCTFPLALLRSCAHIESILCCSEEPPCKGATITCVVQEAVNARQKHLMPC